MAVLNEEVENAELLKMYEEGTVVSEENEENNLPVDKEEEDEGEKNRNVALSAENQDDNDDNDDNDDEYENEVKLFRESLGLDENAEVDFTAEGILKVVQAKIEEVEGKYSKYNEPKIQKIISHILDGGTVESFLDVPEPFNPENYPNSTEEEQESNIAKLYSELKGLSKEEYEPILANIKNTEGGLEKASAIALKALETRDNSNYSEYEKSVQAEKDSLEEQNKTSREEANKAWEEVNINLEKGTIGEYSIPKSDLKGFKEYVETINSTGAREDLTTLDMLRFDYLRYKKWDVGDKSNDMFKEKPRRNATSLISKQQRKNSSNIVGTAEEAMALLASIK